jgi:flagellar motility protein MotE (MotC chaperone)
MVLVSAAAVIANGATLAAPLGLAPQSNRLGSAINRDLTARDAADAQAAREMETREAAAKAAEARIKSQLEAQQQQAANQPATPQPPVDGQYDDLARIYQAMRPAEAAAVFEQLDMDVQMKVAQRMRERSTGLIMARMTPRAAAALTMALARKRANPAPSQAVAPVPAPAPAVKPELTAKQTTVPPRLGVADKH